MKKYKTKFDMSFPLNDENVFCNISEVKNLRVIETRKRERVPVFRLKKGSVVFVEKWNESGLYRVNYGEEVYKIHERDFVDRNLTSMEKEKEFIF